MPGMARRGLFELVVVSVNHYGRAGLGRVGRGKARLGKAWVFGLVAVSANLKPWRRGAGLGTAMRG